MVKIALIILALTVSTAQAKLEKDYNICQNGHKEFVLADKTRIDCLTDTHAIEVEYAKKFYEAIGQSLHYSLNTGKRAGILLIVNPETEFKYWIRLNSVIQHFNLPIDTWVVEK